MPRYYFDIVDGHRLVDQSGLECKDDEDAIAKARVIAEQIAADVDQPSERKLAVRDSDRGELRQISIYPTTQVKRENGNQ